MNKITKLISFIVLCLALTSCWKKDKDDFDTIGKATWSPVLALPLFTTKLTIKDSIPAVLPKLTLSDTASVELPKGSDQDVNTYVVSADFKALTENSFPNTGTIQIYFADNNNVYFDSLLTPSQITVDAGSLSAPSKKEIDIHIDKDRYNKVSKARRMYVILRLNTSSVGGGYSEYSYKVDMGIKATLNTDIAIKTN